MSSFNQFSYCIFNSSLPHFPLTHCALLPWLSPVYSWVSWQHAAPTVPGHVQANSGRGRDIHGGDPECIQPSPHCTPQIWPEGMICWCTTTPTCSNFPTMYFFQPLPTCMCLKAKKHFIDDTASLPKLAATLPNSKSPLRRSTELTQGNSDRVGDVGFIDYWLCVIDWFLPFIVESLKIFFGELWKLYLW